MDEIDVSDGTLVSRIISDLPDPILRLLVSTSDRGQEYLLLVSSANEVRVWDIESRLHLAAFVLGGLRAKQTALVAAAATTGHSRCVLLYSKGGSSQVEAMHIQRQADRPGSATLLAVLEPKAADIKAAAVTAIVGTCAPRKASSNCIRGLLFSPVSLPVHPILPLAAVGTAEGIVTVFLCGFMVEPRAAGEAGGGTGEAGVRCRRRCWRCAAPPRHATPQHYTTSVPSTHLRAPMLSPFCVFPLLFRRPRGRHTHHRLLGLCQGRRRAGGWRLLQRLCCWRRRRR